MKMKVRTVTVLLSMTMFFSFFPTLQGQATTTFPGCNPITNFEKTKTSSNGEVTTIASVDGSYTDWMCFQVNQVKFASNKVSLDGRGVLQQVDIKGNFYFSNCQLWHVDCGGLGLSGVGLLINNGRTQQAGSGDPFNSDECNDFKFNYVPDGNEKFTTIGHPVTNRDSQGALSSGPFVMQVPIFIPANCSSGVYHLSMFWNSAAYGDMVTLDGIPGNSLTILQKLNRPITGASCTNLGTFGTSAKGDSEVCAKINGKLIWAVISSTHSPTPVASKASVAKSPTAGGVCSTPGKTQIVNSKKLACIQTGKHLTWVQISGSKPSSSPSTSTHSSGSNQSPTQADSLKAQGCRAFPGAIVSLQQASGAVSNDAFSNAQEASFPIIQAAALDSKYSSLKTAQYIIIQYVQATNWTGSGFTGDINTVRTALDTFNLACGSSLQIP